MPDSVEPIASLTAVGDVTRAPMNPSMPPASAEYTSSSERLPKSRLVEWAVTGRR